MIPNSTPTARNLWPHAIIAWFVVFACALAAWIAFAVRQDMDLVRPDYYEEEIRFQRHLDLLDRTASVRAEVSIRYDGTGRHLDIRLPRAQTPTAVTGCIRFYRPSDARLDHQVPLAPDRDGHQRLGAEHLRAGLWKVEVQWQAGDQEYLVREPVVVGPGGA